VMPQLRSILRTGQLRAVQVVVLRLAVELQPVRPDHMVACNAGMVVHVR
jgi:hypothetical protein